MSMTHAARRVFWTVVAVAGTFYGTPGFGAAHYQVIPLQDAGFGSNAVDINSGGQIVGQYYLGDGTYHAALWSPNSSMLDLGVLPGQYMSSAKAINNSGQVIGSSQPVDGNPPRAFLWQSGPGMTDIGAAAGLSSAPSAIDDNGRVVGNASPDGFLASTLGFSYTAATGMTLVTLPDFSVDGVFAANDHGQMVFSSNSITNHTQFFYSPGQSPLAITLPVGLPYGAAMAMNNSGFVVGFMASPYESLSVHAYIWNAATGLVDMTPADDAGAIPTDINDAGQVVGFGNFPFLYEDETLFDLGTLLDSSGTGWTFLRPEAINNLGQIAGYGNFNGQVQAFLMTPTPTPEPTTLSLLLLPAAAALLRRRRRPTRPAPPCSCSEFKL
jgi:probable HAF family extracellular repeat protein